MTRWNDLVIELDLDGRGRAVVCLDTATGDSCSGGVRIYEDVSREEVVALGREMTLKFGFIGLERGGAKSGVQIKAGASPQEKREVLEIFGRKIGALIRAGVYYPWPDMNCGPDDLPAIYRGAGIPGFRATDSSFFTALSVAEAVRAVGALEQRSGPFTLAIEGFGSVAAHLAERLSGEAYRIVALSTISGAVTSDQGFDSGELVAAKRRCGDDLVRELPGARAIAKDELLGLPVDILLPGARTGSLHEGNQGKIQARHIVPVANAPYAGTAAAALHRRGITCLPGFVVNSGGVWASSLFDRGVPLRSVEQLSANRFRPVVGALLLAAREQGVSALDVAVRVAEERIEKRTALDARRRNLGWLVRRVNRLGLLPRRVTGHVARTEFEENLGRLAAHIRSSARC